jgi:iron complex transport system substrate-binding protein
VQAATCTWTGHPVEIVSLRPDCMADAHADIRRVARALAAAAAGEALVTHMQARVAAVTRRVRDCARPRVAFVEWVEPLMAGGNWMPELIEAAGGDNLFGEAGRHSGWMQWEQLADADPDVILVAPCGYGLDRCLEELPLLQAKAGWSDLKAVRSGRVYFADGNAYFNRPGPRLADSVEILAEILHPGTVPARHQRAAWIGSPS